MSSNQSLVDLFNAITINDPSTVRSIITSNRELLLLKHKYNSPMPKESEIDLLRFVGYID